MQHKDESCPCNTCLSKTIKNLSDKLGYTIDAESKKLNYNETHKIAIVMSALTYTLSSFITYFYAEDNYTKLPHVSDKLGSNIKSIIEQLNKDKSPPNHTIN